MVNENIKKGNRGAMETKGRQTLTTCSENWLANALMLKDDYSWSINLTQDKTVLLMIWKQGMIEPHCLDLWDAVNQMTRKEKIRKMIRRVK